MTQPTILKSKLDASVNFIIPNDSGFYEARYVRRKSEYFICYLSAQSGCKMACKFCHLTASKQFSPIDATNAILLEQANHVLTHYDSLNQRANVIHYSWMARGEFFDNKLIDWEPLTFGLRKKAEIRGLYPRFTISTILPHALKNKKLISLFPGSLPDLYYSLYSMDPEFRKKWLPSAMPAEDGLDLLSDWQNVTKKIIKLHWAFIDGENDSERDILAITKAVKDRKLRVDFNVVGYNPYAPELGTETPVEKIKKLTEIFESEIPQAKIKIVNRVGRDVYASCGTFIEG